MSDHWLTLDVGERFKIALAVARRRGRSFVESHHNVVSVGAGFRLRGGENQIVEDVCLCFFVSRKWSDRRTRPQKIPETVAAYVIVRGRRIRVRIPTDVSELKGGRPHATLNLTEGITSRINASPMDFASACCLVRNAALPNERYLMSCYHAFSATLDRPPQNGIDCVSSSGTLVGTDVEAADPNGSSALDAALVRVGDSSIQDMSVWGATPVAHATDFDIDSLPLRGPLFILGRRVAPAVDGLPQAVRMEPIPASFRSLITSPTSYDYGSTAGRSFVFADTIEYKAAVRPGDSGSALVDTGGILYGMHFFGRGEFGYSLAAPRLFEPGIFSLDIVI